MKVKGGSCSCPWGACLQRGRDGCLFWLQFGFLWCCRGMWRGLCGAQGGKRCWCWVGMLCSHLRGGWTVSPWGGQPFADAEVQAGVSALCMASAPGKNLGCVVRLCPCLQLRSSEKLLPIPMFCIMATAVVWAAALYFFFQNLSSWEVKFPFYSPVYLSSSFLPVVCFTQKILWGRVLHCSWRAERV